jgi:hypothetical protein
MSRVTKIVCFIILLGFEGLGVVVDYCAGLVQVDLATMPEGRLPRTLFLMAESVKGRGYLLRRRAKNSSNPIANRTMLPGQIQSPRSLL